MRSAPADILEAALAGDLVAASGSVWVGTPEGDVAAYLDSLARLVRLAPPVLGPGHGPAIIDTVARLEELSAHRLERERQVLKAVEEGRLTATAITQAIYPQAEGKVADLARRSVLAHLAKLGADRLVEAPLAEDGEFKRT